MQNQIIDVAIGLALAFMVVSVLVSAIQEIVAGLLNSRSAQLEKGIKCLLFGKTDLVDAEEQKFIKDLFNHPLLFNLSPGEKLASYLPSNNFALALVEVASAKIMESGRGKEGIRDLASAVDSDSWRRLLSSLEAEAKGDMGLLRREIEKQYEQMMDRVSGWYKRRSQGSLLFYGFFLAVLLNVDALDLSRRLWTYSVTRAVVVASASELETRTHGDPQKMEEGLVSLNGMQSLPVGWPTKWTDGKAYSNENKAIYFVISLIGWLITALASSLGAPFWFDIIGKFVRLKNAGGIPQRQSGGTQESVPVSVAAISSPTAQEPADNRNAIIDLNLARNTDDDSYRPVKLEERW